MKTPRVIFWSYLLSVVFPIVSGLSHLYRAVVAPSRCGHEGLRACSLSRYQQSGSPTNPLAFQVRQGEPVQISAPRSTEQRSLRPGGDHLGWRCWWQSSDTTLCLPTLKTAGLSWLLIFNVVNVMIFVLHLPLPCETVTTISLQHVIDLTTQLWNSLISTAKRYSQNQCLQRFPSHPIHLQLSSI